VNKVATGISGLDEMLNGGLPTGRSIVVLGGPGSEGKEQIVIQRTP